MRLVGEMGDCGIERRQGALKIERLCGGKQSKHNGGP
jgi:hypothetical protein